MLPNPASPAIAFDIGSLGSCAIVVGGDRTEHVAIRLGAVTLRIDISGTLRCRPTALHFSVSADRALSCQIAALHRFAALFGSPLPPTTISVLPDARLSRLVTALRVLDGLNAGTSLRGIATVLSLAPEEWPGPGESAKSRVRRLVDLARRLKKGEASAVLAYDV